MKKNELALTGPSLAWLLLFFLLPAVLVIVISFRASDSYGTLLHVWTLDAYRALGRTHLLPVIMRTLRISLLTTLICLFLALPFAYGMARLSRQMQQNLMLLLIVPFWTNFIIRIYAWKVLLHPDGLIRQFLVFTGLIGNDVSLLYNEGAVLLILVYTYLPFAILPLYSAAEKFDFTLLDAGRDLGAGSVQIIFRIFLPGISSGILNAVLVVFIPALGSYIIPEIVGGTESEMLGNKIAQYVFTDRNLPRAGALSGILILIILLPSLLSLLKRNGPGEGGRG